MNTRRLPHPAPARVLALGAWLKNTLCLLDGAVVHGSPLHGDLGTPEACLAMERSAEALLARGGGSVDAVAHDLHPDFPSTRLAQALAARLGVPAVAVQHHHAHVAVVQAEACVRGPLVGLALDGVGLGSDGTPWGGELLQAAGGECRRLGHLTPLPLPGGDIAAREPWRMAAALLQGLGQGDRIVPRFGPVVGERLAAGVHTLLQRGLNCPRTTSAGRWFDAIAGLLGLSVRQDEEAQAAIALEQAATAWVARHGEPEVLAGGLDLLPLARWCLDAVDVGEAAARFHAGLAAALAQAATGAAVAAGTRCVALTGGCFHNGLLTASVSRRLQAAGLAPLLPRGPGPGDAGLALGQAWAAAHRVAQATPRTEATACA